MTRRRRSLVRAAVSSRFRYCLMWRIKQRRCLSSSVVIMRHAMASESFTVDARPASRSTCTSSPVFQCRKVSPNVSKVLSCYTYRVAVFYCCINYDTVTGLLRMWYFQVMSHALGITYVQLINISGLAPWQINYVLIHFEIKLHVICYWSCCIPSPGSLIVTCDRKQLLRVRHRSQSAQTARRDVINQCEYFVLIRWWRRNQSSLVIVTILWCNGKSGVACFYHWWHLCEVRRNVRWHRQEMMTSCIFLLWPFCML